MATAPKISNLPAAPNRQQPANFSAKGDALLSSLQGFATEANALGDYVEGAAGQVAIDKAAVDANVPLLTDAKAAAPLALSYRDTAKTYRDAAAASEAKALQHKNDAASAVVYQDLASIALSKNLTMVDGCIDTSPNPSLAVQRRTSWYNEARGTATRGTRREMPARKVVIAEAANITIFDGDDPSLPVWKVIPKNSTSGYISDGYGQSVSSVASENGVIVVGLTQLSPSDAGTYGGGLIFDFGGDTTEKLGGKLKAFSKSGKKSGITSDQSGYLAGGGRHLIYGYVNSVTMHVASDAPIDPVSGLQVPTIAVGTDAGASVINSDGEVTNSASILGFANVFFDKDGDLYFTRNNFGANLIFAPRDSYKLNGFGETLGLSTSGSDIDMLAGAAARNQLAIGDALFLGGGTASTNSRKGLMIHQPNKADFSKGMTAFVTTEYNTGIMASGCLGTLMCSTDTAALVGSGELVTNGTFDGNVANWTPLGDGSTIVYDANGNAEITSNGDYGAAYQAVDVVVGETYVAEIIEASSFVRLRVGGSPNLFQFVNTANISNGVQVSFTPTVTPIYVTLATTQAGGTVSVKRVSIAKRDSDRSVNNKGLIVNGTKTRTPVAPGSELVGYDAAGSGYLNRNFDGEFTGFSEFTLSGWYFGGSGLFWAWYETKNGGTSTSFLNAYMSAATKSFRLLWQGRSVIIPDGEGAPVENRWSKIDLCFRGGGAVDFYQDGKFVGSYSGSQNIAVHELRFLYAGGTCKMSQFKPYDRALLADEIRFMYEQERPMFQPGAQVTLYGTYDAVTVLAYDEATGLTHVGTSAGRSDFAGLVRVSQTDTPITTKIVAHDGMILEQ